jgi:hypothetical protein
MDLCPTASLVFDVTSAVCSNPASMAVLRKVGFEQEAVLRRAVIKNGQILDIHVHALFRPESSEESGVSSAARLTTTVASVEGALAEEAACVAGDEAREGGACKGAASVS